MAEPLRDWEDWVLARELRFRLRFEHAGTNAPIDMHSQILCEAVARNLGEVTSGFRWEQEMRREVELPVNYRVLDLDCPSCGRNLGIEYSGCRGTLNTLKCFNASCSEYETRYEWPKIKLKVVENGQ